MERDGGLSASGHRPATVRNRRVDRTYRALLTAFRDLMFERGYGRITVRAIIDRADVGRSTFYEHFRNKEDVLRESVAPVLTPLADVLTPRHSAEQLRLVVEHMWVMRRRAGAAMLGATRPVVARLLAELIEERLAVIAAERGAGQARVPLHLAAGALADAQIGLLAAWMRGDDPASADAVAHALADITAGAARALLHGAAPGKAKPVQSAR